MNEMLAAALEDAGFSGSSGRARLALALGVDSVTVWRWLTGKSSPGSDGTYVAIARELGRTEDDVRSWFDAPRKAAA